MLAKEEQIKYIVDCLALLSFRIDSLNSICLFDVNHIGEDVYRDLLNAIFGYKLENVNSLRKNAKAIDLVDKNATPGLLVQVSSLRTKKKVQESLNKIDVKAYHGFHFIFVSLVRDPPDWGDGVFRVPSGIKFSPKEDVFGPKKIVDICYALKRQNLKGVYKVCLNHFHNDFCATSKLSLEHVQKFIALMSETSKFESIIRGYCLELQDGCGAWTQDRLSRVCNLMRNQLRACFSESAVEMIGYRQSLLCDHQILSKVRQVEDIHLKIDAETIDDMQTLNVENIVKLIDAEFKLVCEILDLFSEHVGIDKVDLHSEYVAAMNA